MLHFACVAIFSNQILENKQVVIPLLVRGSKIGKKKGKDSLNALEILKLTALEIQKDIVRAIASETLNAIIRDLGNAIFSILVDESRDLSGKEQMAVA